MFNPEETASCKQLVALAVHEDLDGVGDLTSAALFDDNVMGGTVLVARQAGVLAGLPAVPLVLQAVDTRLELAPTMTDGDLLAPGKMIARISGPLRGILASERTLLNLLQHLSGIATLTRRYVDAVAGLPCSILDTRKTLPGWRRLAKYAVRQGGGVNHRLGLHDGILIKDNHLAGLKSGTSAIVLAIQKARGLHGRSVGIEVEVDTIPQLAVALVTDVDAILLDNMPLDMLCEAVRMRNEANPRIKLEASGGVNLLTVRSIAETGVDRISIGALTHSAPALDIGLDYV